VRPRIPRRDRVVLGILVLAILGAAAVGLGTGAYPLSPPQALDALLGGGDAQARFIVADQRLPRVVCAIAVGAALGLSGMVFQSVSRNPLGSPDVIGFSTGAATGGLVAILVTGSTAAAPSSAGSIALGTVVGGFATAFAVHLMSSRTATTGERLVLVGIAVGAMLASVNDFLITRSDLELAQAAATWRFGTLNGISWPQVAPAVAVLAVIVPLAFLGEPPLRMLEMGDDTARALGLDVGRWRTALLAAGVALAAVGVAAVGPVGFVALAAPHLARRVMPGSRGRMLPALVVGALLLSVADLVAGRLLSPFQIPVGLATSALGGIYLLWLLASPDTSRRAASGG
jgi:iron complex transport system permease protein